MTDFVSWTDESIRWWDRLTADRWHEEHDVIDILFARSLAGEILHADSAFIHDYNGKIPEGYDVRTPFDFEEVKLARLATRVRVPEKVHRVGDKRRGPRSAEVLQRMRAGRARRSELELLGLVVVKRRGRPPGRKNKPQLSQYGAYRL